MTEINPEGTDGAGGDDKVVLTKKEHDEMVEALAKRKEAEARLKDEVTTLREKNRELAKSPEPTVSEEQVQKAMAEEFKKRDAEAAKAASEQATAEFLDSHPEFSKENDTDGSKFAAFQESLKKLNLQGVKTKEQYTQALHDALRLTNQAEPAPTMLNFSSTPRSAYDARAIPQGSRLSAPEQKLVQRSFGGDVEAYLKVKAKRPEYVEELLRYVR